MRSISVLGSLAAAALVLLLMWFRRTQDGQGNAAEPVEQARAPAATLAEPAAGPDAAEAPASLPVEGAQRDALESSAAPVPTCLVRVVEAGTGKPLPGARLWIQLEDVDRDGPEWWRAMRRFNDVEPALAGGLGREVALDERGEAHVPRPARTLTVAAALGALHGAVGLEPRAETCVVELKPYHALTVEVVDRAGKPVPHALVVFFWGEFDPLEDSNTLQADEEGRLVTAKLEHHINEHTDRGPVRLTLAGGVPCEPELVEFTLESVPSEPVRLVAGDFGSVVVQLADPQGRVLPLEGSAHLDVDTYFMPEPSLTLRAGSGLSRPLDEGRAVFPCIGLGLQLSIMAAAKGYGGNWRECAGPTRPGEELRVLIPLGERQATVRGRVLGATSAGSLRGKASARASFHVPIQDDGTFERTFQTYEELALLARPWELRFERKDAPTFGATIVPRVDAERMAIDFGEIVLAPLAALARVRVVDDAGVAVPHARVEIRSSSDTDGRWCDEHGLVQVEGRSEELPLRVRATHQAWLASDWLEITAPGTEATLALRRGAALEGRALLPRGANLHWCELHLSVTPAAGGREALKYESELVEGGRFRYEACEPGLARLSVIYDDQPVLERDGIELVVGKTTDLGELDLRTALHPFTLTFELASGAPWLGGHLEVREPGGETSSWVTIGPSARAFLLCPRPELDLWVAGRGARATRFEGVLDGDRLVLPDAPSVVLRLAREIPLPEPPLALVVRAMRTKPEEVAFETDDDVDGADAVAGADGLVRLAVPWPGEYELAWCIRHTGTGAEFDIEQEELQTVTIDDTTATSLVDARLTPAAVAQALLEAKGR